MTCPPVSTWSSTATGTRRNGAENAAYGVVPSGPHERDPHVTVQVRGGLHEKFSDLNFGRAILVRARRTEFLQASPSKPLAGPDKADIHRAVPSLSCCWSAPARHWRAAPRVHYVIAAVEWGDLSEPHRETPSIGAGRLSASADNLKERESINHHTKSFARNQFSADRRQAQFFGMDLFLANETRLMVGSFRCSRPALGRSRKGFRGRLDGFLGPRCTCMEAPSGSEIPGGQPEHPAPCRGGAPPRFAWVLISIVVVSIPFQAYAESPAAPTVAILGVESSWRTSHRRPR